MQKDSNIKSMKQYFFHNERVLHSYKDIVLWSMKSPKGSSSSLILNNEQVNAIFKIVENLYDLVKGKGSVDSWCFEEKDGLIFLSGDNGECCYSPLGGLAYKMGIFENYSINLVSKHICKTIESVITRVPFLAVKSISFDASVGSFTNGELCVSKEIGNVNIKIW